MTTGTLKVDHETTITTPASYVAALIGFLYTVNWEKTIYVALAIATFGINWFYQHRRHQREEDAAKRLKNRPFRGD